MTTAKADDRKFIITQGVAMAVLVAVMIVINNAMSLCTLGTTSVIGVGIALLCYTALSLLVKSALGAYSDNAFFRFSMVNKFVRMFFVLILILGFAVTNKGNVPNIIAAVVVCGVLYYATIVIEMVTYSRIDAKKENHEA